MTKERPARQRSQPHWHVQRAGARLARCGWPELKCGPLLPSPTHTFGAIGQVPAGLVLASFQSVSQWTGSVVPCAGAEGVTHVVHPFGPDGDPDDGKHYMRSLEARCACVHMRPAASAPAELLCLASAAGLAWLQPGAAMRCAITEVAMKGARIDMEPLLMGSRQEVHMCHLWRRGAEVRVHWWYRPDSFDEFIPAATAPAELEADQPHPGALLRTQRDLAVR